MYKRVNELLGTNYKSDKEVYFSDICLKEKINEEFVEEFSNKLDWNYISMNPNLTENFIRNHVDKIDFVNISSCSTLSEDFIREFSDKLDWSSMSSFQNLSESIIEEFSNRLDWEMVSIYQTLSENFIERHKDKVSWDSISSNQLLSWSFILKFKDLVNWDYISIKQPYINSEYERIDKESLKNNKLYNLYQQTKDRGWFFGYLESYCEKDKFFIVNLNKSDFIGNIIKKIRIYWKDLVLVDKAEKFDIIREIKYV